MRRGDGEEETVECKLRCRRAKDRGCYENKFINDRNCSGTQTALTVQKAARIRLYVASVTGCLETSLRALISTCVILRLYNSCRFFVVINATKSFILLSAMCICSENALSCLWFISAVLSTILSNDSHFLYAKGSRRVVTQFSHKISEIYTPSLSVFALPVSSNYMHHTMQKKA